MSGWRVGLNDRGVRAEKPAVSATRHVYDPYLVL